MNRRHPYPLRVASATIAFGFAICAAAAGRVEQISTPTASSPPAERQSSSAEIDEAHARVDATRARVDASPFALADALAALGDVSLRASQFDTAEAAYAEALRLAEQHGGSESGRVLAPLLGLGDTFAASGHHEEAVPLLERALAMQRAQFGLFDLRQQDTLATLAASLTALDRVPEAQDLMVYRVRAAEKAYGEANPKVIPAVCDLGHWFAEIGKTPEARLTFQMALNIVGASPFLKDPIIVEPLRGIARAYMLRSSYPEGWRRRTWPREFYQEGEDALLRALRILDENPDTPTQTRIDTLIQMGDWHQIKKSPREALAYYQRAWQLIRTTPNESGSATAALNVPVRVYYPTPQIVAHVPSTPLEETRSHSVQVEFTVAADGSVRDARIVDHDTRDTYARDVLDAVRESRFRPKFIDGQAVATPGITYREVFWTEKPRT